MTQAQRQIKSVLGPLYLVSSERGLRGIFWEKQNAPAPQPGDPTAEMLDQAEIQLLEYLNGERKTFDVPLDLQGTDFQKIVWAQLLKIPYGKTLSYKELAKRVGNEKASRAVGTANGKNPICILVPCHRVIASDGTLGGYSGGLEIKRKLLDLEAGPN